MEDLIQSLSMISTLSLAALLDGTLEALRQRGADTQLLGPRVWSMVGLETIFVFVLFTSHGWPFRGFAHTDGCTCSTRSSVHQGPYMCRYCSRASSRSPTCLAPLETRSGPYSSVKIRPHSSSCRVSASP
jgi:hypothetical protein